jgi:hypothetical protein
MGGLVAKFGQDQLDVTLAPTVATVAFLITDEAIVKSIRFFVKNTGSTNALTAALLEGSNDKGATWVTLDATAVTAALATIAHGAAGTIFEDNLYFDSIRLTLTSTAGTTAHVYATINNNE